MSFFENRSIPRCHLTPSWSMAAKSCNSASGRANKVAKVTSSWAWRPFIGRIIPFRVFGEGYGHTPPSNGVFGLIRKRAESADRYYGKWERRRNCGSPFCFGHWPKSRHSNFRADLERPAIRGKSRDRGASGKKAWMSDKATENVSAYQNGRARSGGADRDERLRIARDEIGTPFEIDEIRTRCLQIHIEKIPVGKTECHSSKFCEWPDCRRRRISKVPRVDSNRARV
jgi:hypothetical protein